MANSRGWRVSKGRTETQTRPALDAQEVTRVAYELYVQRGRVDGHDFADWLKAEQIVRQRAAVGNTRRW
jgi:hypothetical protein